MHATTLQGILEHLRKLTNPTRDRDLSDAELLERFRLGHEEAAFTLLVQRHGPMVLAICRRMLGDVHEAEDAFQATFLVLVRNAGTIRKQQSFAAWLHGVASRIAHKARMRCVRQQVWQREILSPIIVDDPSKTLAAAELRSVLDEEIECLPAKYRMPLVLCYLTDKTHEQAAGELGWPKSSVTARLAKARQLLHQRLIRRGFTAPAGLLAALLIEQTANAVVPSLLTLSTVRLAVQALTGETLTVTSVTALASSLVKGTTALRLTATLALLAMLGFAAAVGQRLMPLGAPAQRENPESKVQAAGNPRGSKAEVRKPRFDLQGDPLPDEVVARMGSGRLRHGGGATSLAFSPNGGVLVSDGYSDLRIWDLKTGKPLRRFHADSARTNSSFRFTPDGVACAVQGEKGTITIQIVDGATGQVRRRVHIKEEAAPKPIFSPDGKRIAFATKNGLGLFDTITGEMVLRIPVKGIFAWDIAFAADGKTIAFNDLTDTIYLHDAGTGKLVRERNRPRPGVIFFENRSGQRLVFLHNLWHGTGDHGRTDCSSDS